MNCICKRETLTVPWGNDFKIHLCRKDVAPGNPDNIDFSAITNLKAYATRDKFVNISLLAEVANDGDIVISIPAEINRLATYGIELSGKFQGHDWRWKCCEVFNLSECNCDSTVQGMESFDVETYYIWDVLDFVIEDDTLDVISEGHAWIEDDVLYIVDTDSTTVRFEDEKMIVITE